MSEPNLKVVSAFGPINFFEDEPEQKDAPPATIERLLERAARMRELEIEIAQAQVKLAELTDELGLISEKTIPTIMTELGLEEFKMTDGAKINVKDDIKCSITEERKPAAWAWLESTSNDGIIKTSVQTTFGRGEIQEAKELQAKLFDMGFEAAIERGVHPATLKSFVKEQLENGVNIPLETFGVYERKVTKISLPRKKK